MMLDNLMLELPTPVPGFDTEIFAGGGIAPNLGLINYS